MFKIADKPSSVLLQARTAIALTVSPSSIFGYRLVTPKHPAY